MAAVTIDQLALVPRVSSEYRPFSISPDGSTLAFQWYREGNWQIYLIDGDGSGDPRRVAAIDDACWCPQFSPDGRYLYFARDDRGSECYDIYREDLSSGELENLLPDTPRFSPNPDFSLSPDGARIALSADHGESYAAAVMPAAAEPNARHVHFVADHYFNDHTPCWSPNGRLVAFAADTEGQDTALFVGDPDGGDMRAVGGEQPLLAAQPAWSPNGEMVAFSGGDGEHAAIGVFAVAQDIVLWLTAGDCDAHHPTWSPDGRRVAFVSEHGGENSLRVHDLSAGEETRLAVSSGNHYAPRFTPDGSAIVVVFSGPAEPDDLYRLDIASGTATRLTHSLPEELRGQPFVSARPVRYRSLDRLADVPGLLSVPPEPNGGAVVYLHGGPTWHHSNEWDPLRLAFLAAGYHVLSPNYRGSDGYGRTWQLANRYLVGQGEVQDCAGAHAFLVSRGCSPERIAVTGRSWGGFLTMACLTQFPELFACGVAGVPFFDFIDSQVDPAVREDLRWWDHENSGNLERDRARLEYFSPINHLDRMRAPVLLLAAENDPRCPPTQVAEVAERLRSQGIVCETVVYAGEGHEISGFEHRLDYDRRTVAFIARYLGA